MKLDVETTSGKMRGRERRGVRTWRGIPYATAERFRPPRPVPRRDRDAFEFGPFAMQSRDVRAQMMSGVTAKTQIAEDSHVLNIYAPAGAERCPVVVWIHGGAFIMGAGSQPLYDGTSFAAKHGIVVVTLNYRLGLFGLMYLGDLLGPDFERGNCCLLDQIAALEWVRENIAGFGGDPHAVTVMGESAGSISAASLLATPAARGLFRRAILQSGAPGLVTRTRAEATQLARDVLAYLGISEREALDVPAERLVEAQGYLSTLRGLGAFAPYVDGVTLPGPPVERVASGTAAGIPILIGTNRDEWALFDVFFGAPATQAVVAQLRQYLGAGVIDAMHARYVAARADRSADRAWVDLIGDLGFRIPAIRVAEAQAPHAPVYMYRFDFATDALGGRLGAAHALELPFVWNVMDSAFAQLVLGADHLPAVQLAARMHGAWASFIRDGIPDAAWPAYEPTRRATMLFDRDVCVADDPAGELRVLWG